MSIIDRSTTDRPKVVEDSGTDTPQPWPGASDPFDFVSEILGYRVEGVSSPDQAWFWTPAWQQREREADADFNAGRSASFDSIEGLLDDLDAD